YAYTYHRGPRPFPTRRSSDLKQRNYIGVEMGTEKLNNRPVIIGSGPAGLFAALVLAQRGFNPIMLERGLDVDNRTNDINNFWNRSEEHTSELQSRFDLVCRLL